MFSNQIESLSTFLLSANKHENAIHVQKRVSKIILEYCLKRM